MLDPKTAIENIYTVAKLIYDQVQLVSDSSLSLRMTQLKSKS